MKKKDIVLREYARSLNEEDLKFVASRLSFTYGRRGGDVPGVLEFVQETANPDNKGNYPPDAADFLRSSYELDRILMAARDHGHLFDLIDDLQEQAEREIRRRITLEREGNSSAELS